MKAGIIFCVVLVCFLSENIHSQDTVSSPFIFHGVLLDSVSGSVVGYGHIYNESRRKGAISDTNGRFRIWANISDTLVFISLSHLGRIYIVKPLDIKREVPVKMMIRLYEIDALEFEIPRTYKALQEAILEIDPKEGKPMPELPQHNSYITPKLLDTNYIYSNDFKVWHPISAYYYKHNKEEQSKRKLWMLQEQELYQPMIDKKYNIEMLSRITGFTGDTVLNFMLYCNFSFNYLYESTELEIIEEIDRQKKLFIEHCYGQCIPVTVPTRNKKER
ncbi:MAG: hypothetical protein JXA77_12770 [Bacteroidales bacterium]|nr:hypothetical protein [Bacteroidales bacterium]MBN2820465.1 hypothetical protein [Bacteroidales bacterium]